LTNPAGVCYNRRWAPFSLLYYYCSAPAAYYHCLNTTWSAHRAYWHCLNTTWSALCAETDQTLFNCWQLTKKTWQILLTYCIIGAAHHQYCCCTTTGAPAPNPWETNLFGVTQIKCTWPTNKAWQCGGGATAPKLLYHTAEQVASGNIHIK